MCIFTFLRRIEQRNGRRLQLLGWHQGSSFVENALPEAISSSGAVTSISVPAPRFVLIEHFALTLRARSRSTSRMLDARDNDRCGIATRCDSRLAPAVLPRASTPSPRASTPDLTAGISFSKSQSITHSGQACIACGNPSCHPPCPIQHSPMQSVRIRVPATTANLGPGFDCLGIALQLYNSITVVASEPPPDNLVDPDTMADAAARSFFATAKCDPFPFRWRVAGKVPRSRGLGSSVTVRLGLLHGLNRLAGSPLDPTALFHLCAALEGHPDNAAPAAFGGFTIARPDGRLLRFPVHRRLAFVLLVPDFEMRTADARRVLPHDVPLRDAARNGAYAAAIAAAFAARRYEELTGCFDDLLHQPFREPLIRCLRPVIEAGVAAGALGGWLSGSGSTIACVTLSDPVSVVAAMSAASGQTAATTHIVRADNHGVRVTAGSQ
jgi:homoserine kinase